MSRLNTCIFRFNDQQNAASFSQAASDAWGNSYVDGTKVTVVVSTPQEACEAMNLAAAFNGVVESISE